MVSVTFSVGWSLLGAGSPTKRKSHDVWYFQNGTDDAVNVLCLCLDIADQDGIGPDEEAQLKKIAQALQLPLEQYL